jgi:hypothetical protein
MAAVMSYSDTLREIFTRVAGYLDQVKKPHVQTVLFADDAQGNYLLRRVGWHAGDRVNNTVFFARVRDGKVWIEEDNTDLSLADELLAAGVPKSDIVLAFHAPEERRFGEFAVG